MEDEEPSTQQIGVYGVEHRTHEDYDERHAAFSAHEQGEDEGAAEVMQQEQRSAHVGTGGGVRSFRTEPHQQRHACESRKFHQHPSRLVRKRTAPSAAIRNAVGSLDASQGAPHYNRNECHPCKDAGIDGRLIDYVKKRIHHRKSNEKSRYAQLFQPMRSIVHSADRGPGEEKEGASGKSDTPSWLGFRPLSGGLCGWCRPTFAQ